MGIGIVQGRLEHSAGNHIIPVQNPALVMHRAFPVAKKAGLNLQLSVRRCILNDIPGRCARLSRAHNRRSEVEHSQPGLAILALAMQLAPQTLAPSANAGLDWFVGLD